MGSTIDIVWPFLDGQPTAESRGELIDVVNPANGRAFLSIPQGTQGDVDRAVVSARAAFDDGLWRDMAPSRRGSVLASFANLIGANATALDALDAAEMGKPVAVSFGNGQAAANTMRFFSEAVDKLTGDVYASDRNSFVTQRRVPRGVVAAIVPWNFPTYVAALKIAPALAAGNSVILKPSELASRSSIRLAQLAIDAGLPPGMGTNRSVTRC